MSGQTPRWVRQITADKKKLGMMLGLLAVGMLLWGRLLLKQVPRTAVAVPTASLAEAGQSGSLAGEFTPTIKRPLVQTLMQQDLTRDLFGWPTSHYTLAPQAGTDSSATAGVEKSGSDTADVVQDSQLIATAKGRLKLEATVPGERPRALVNGLVVFQGQSVDGWVLKEVRQRSVILELTRPRVGAGATSGSVTFELEL